MGMLIFGASLAALGVVIMFVAVLSRFSHNRAQAATARVESLRALVDEARSTPVTPRASKGWGLKVRQTETRTDVYIEPQTMAHIESGRMSNTFVVNVPDASDAGAGRISFSRGVSHE